MTGSISAVVICLNEEANIGDCLDALAFCDERVVVDSGSSDATARIAAAAGGRVFGRTFDDFASQKNFAVSKASGEWVLLVDADERVTLASAAEIRKAVESGGADAFYLPRLNRLFGRWMRHGANAGDWQLRLIKKGSARFEGIVHERIAFPGRAKRLKNPLLHHSTPTMSAYMGKLNRYSELEAKLLVERGGAFSPWDLRIRPAAVFFRQFFWRSGWRDGVEGFFLAFLSAYYEFVRRAKHWELKNHKGSA